MDNKDLIDRAYEIADNYNAILKGNIKICGNVNCILFGHYCKSTLFYKDFIKVTSDIFKVSKVAKNNLNEIKKLLKLNNCSKIRTKGIFAVYGDLRPLAVEAGFGKWGDDGIILNEKYGSNFLISAIFYKQK